MVSSDIAESATWTSDNVYSLEDQIYVLPGATLMIEAGTVIASSSGVGGSLAVARGAKIFVNGTQDEPVIMTSTADVATWDDDPQHPSGKDPKSGTWREGANEWGNLTIMGNGLISASHFDGEAIPGNTKYPTGMNQKQMEGLTADSPGDQKVLYGGSDDNDDSGSISYLSIRYAGRVIGLGNELNGLSLGAIGRETDIHHVEIMNNVDDGIEIWGGAVCLHHISIWNVGDDSFDVDQGWRGKAQFGLIVQGYSLDADQGSGVGDNCLETDGAEDSDAQPVTTTSIYNFTVIGQPIAGDGGTTWRDNARVQYRNCIFMDLGEQLVRFDGDDGDGASGYGYNGTLSWEDTWTTDAGTHSLVNAATDPAPEAFNHPDNLYTVQKDGKLAEIKDSVFFRNLASNAYTQAMSRGVFEEHNNNVLASEDAMPIRSITRAQPVERGGLQMIRVTSLNPLASNDAMTSVGAAPADGCFVSAHYRGAFNHNDNWLLGWTAADAYGMTEGLEEELITENIATSTTWTADKIYNLQNQIYVLPGASLTIEPGTLVRSTAGVGGSLAVARGGKIFVNGTKNKPVIMTSSNDNLSSWHEGANEWGNLTIMGNGLISASHFDGEVIPGNTKYPTGMNQKQMEGLTADSPGDQKVIYGGADDNDDSGSISYLSIRYAGRVIGLGNELNGLSLGGIGRETDIHHVEIMNNVDDGIEIWGGTVNLKYLNMWNVGDDSLDCDQGWRGKAQFGLIVQGYSADADQGSGVGDNCLETDGAEDSDAQPVTTSTIYNFTVVGQPIAGDGGTTWRDNARVQYRNCVFMDLGEQLVRFDGDDGDGASGYGYNDTLSWEETWMTNAGVHSGVNAATDAEPGDFNYPDTLYQVQKNGKLAEIKDSVFFNNLASNAYTEAENVGVLDPSNNNLIAEEGVSPIQGIDRAAPVQRGGLTMLRVTDIDPRAANDAVVSINQAPSDGFFTPAGYRGAFSPYNNWLEGWSAVESYGMTDTSNNTAVEGVEPTIPGDANGDGIVNAVDLLIVMENWMEEE
ncbi:MAG: hypothetical protein KC944_08740 [Candidatus Omnitrophica bacterium]|nr:hypothetical protein [Candidatus Omnitrophota bacterium]